MSLAFVCIIGVMSNFESVLVNVIDLFVLVGIRAFFRRDWKHAHARAESYILHDHLSFPDYRHCE